VAGADRVAVAGLAIDLAAAVLTDGIVADQGDRPGGEQAPQEEACEQAGEAEAGPAGSGEDAPEATSIAPGEGPRGAQEVGDGVAAGGE